MHGDDGGPDGDLRGGTVGVLDGEDHRDDGAGPGQQRHAEGDEGDVDVLGLLRLLGLAGEQVERDEQQQEATGDHQRRYGDVQVGEDLVTQHAEDGDDAEGDADGLEGHLPLDLGGAAGGQRQEDRHDPRRVHDHEEGDEEGGEYGDVEHGGALTCSGAGTAAR